MQSVDKNAILWVEPRVSCRPHRPLEILLRIASRGGHGGLSVCPPKPRFLECLSVAIDRERVLVAAQKFVEKKKYDRAVLEYQKIIAEDPNDARTLLKIGDLQSKMET